ncbi:MAG: helix-turn-helix domain-containing protein [Mariniphaga sp.]|nr:helix-turn-helix domain-containing protein [Mariniphaga sp.]
MNLYLTDDNEFIEHLSRIILDNLSNENFGVNELIKTAELNRNYLSRRIKSIKNITINQFITEVRLEKAREFLLEGKYNASEVSYNVGFSSPSYFNKCFHDHFGYPPGDIKKRTAGKSENNIQKSETEKISSNKTGSKNLFKAKNTKSISVIASFAALIGIIFIYIFFFQKSSFLKSNSIEKSIAVLPFKNLSENEANRYFADGVVEDILDRLSKISELRVTSRTSVEQFRTSNESAPEIGKKLKVNYLLEGSVQRHEEKVRITIQLIDAKNDRHILSEKIDRDMKDILELESDIAKLIADKLQAAISPEEKKLIEKTHTHNTEAYDYYLMGRYYWNLQSIESHEKCIEYFEKAINADSTYALAYAGLADAYFFVARFIRIPVKNYEKAVELSKKALEIDENLPEAYAILGAVYSVGYWRWEESEKYFEKAMEIDSNNLVTLYYYSDWLNTTGEFDLSRKHLNRALELDPFSIKFRRSSSYFYYTANKAKEALQEILMVEGMIGDQAYHQHVVFLRYLNAGDTISALQYMQKIFATSPIHQKYKVYADQVLPVYKSSGLKGIYQMMYKNPPNYWYAVQMDSLDLAIRYLEQVYENRHPITIEYILDRDYKKLHNDPRFLEIADKTGLTPYFNKRYKK